MQDPLFSNKVAAAILTALILVFGLPQLTKALLGGGHHGGDGELHLAYCCVDLEAQAPAGGGEPEVVDLGTLLANASAAGGERRAALCRSCHTFEQGGADGAGPNLWNVVNRPLASVAGFNYSGALTAAGGVWSYDRLDQYIKDSQAYIPGTAMAQRFARDDQRADILAYLGSLSDNPAPFPAPAVVEEVVDEALEEAASTPGEAADAAADAVIEAAEDAAGVVTDAAESAADVATEDATIDQQ